MPASAMASLATRTTRLSTVSASSLPNGVWAQPMMQAVMTTSKVPSANARHRGHRGCDIWLRFHASRDLNAHSYEHVQDAPQRLRLTDFGQFRHRIATPAHANE